MGFGGGGSPSVPPPPPPAEKPQTAKPVTEAATAARNAQKDKAARAGGIRGSIHTNPLAGAEEQGGFNTLLGR